MKEVMEEIIEQETEMLEKAKTPDPIVKTVRKKKQPKEDDKNEFTFAGAITRMVKGKGNGVTYVTLVTRSAPSKRVDNDGRVRKHNNYPSICVFDQELRNELDKFERGDRVIITGYVSSGKDTTNRDNFPPQTFVATSIQKAIGSDVNQVNVSGTIQNAWIGRGKNINFVIVSFRENRKYMKRIRCSIFPGDPNQNPLEFIHPGAKMEVIGYCRTDRKEKPDGTVTHFEGIIAQQCIPL